MLHVIWMDSHHAEIYALHPNGTFEHRKVIRHDQDHHTRNLKDHQHPPEKFFKDLSAALLDSNEMLLTGPGLAKGQFKHFLERHHAQDLAKRIVGLETVDHPTEAQIKAQATKTFARLHPHYPIN